MLRTITRITANRSTAFSRTSTASYATGSNPKSDMAKDIDQAARAAGEAKDTSPENPSVLSSAGAVGKQFNPDGNIGQIAEKIGGPFSSDGAIGSQFDASKEGLAGQVEKAVDGPSKK